MKTIGVVGHNGFIGGSIMTGLSSSQYSVVPYDPINEYDIVIDANGNSKKFWANENPVADFEKSTMSVYSRVVNKNFKRYIYISSLDIFNDNFYGRNKLIAEIIVQTFCQKWNILRCGSVIGSGMKKGVLFDLLNDQPIRIHPYSRLQFITTDAITEIIEIIVRDNIDCQSLNVAGRGNVSPIDIAELLQKAEWMKPEDICESDKERQRFEFGVSDTLTIYPKLKTSLEYVKDVIDERMV